MKAFCAAQFYKGLALPNLGRGSRGGRLVSGDGQSAGGFEQQAPVVDLRATEAPREETWPQSTANFSGIPEIDVYTRDVEPWPL